jgi:transposase
MPDHQSPSVQTPALFIGIDWADKKHDVYCFDQQGKGKAEQLEHTNEAIDAWITEKLQQAAGQPIAIILEQARGALVHALMFRENVWLYPINPQQFANYRKSYSNAGCKADLTDARLLARMLCERRHILRRWQPDDEGTRVLARLCENRRQLVDERTRLTQQLIQRLKSQNSFIWQLDVGKTFNALVLALLKRWPDPREMQRADRRWLDRMLKDHGYRNQEQRTDIIKRIRSATLVCRDRAVLEPSALVVRSLVKQIEVLQEAITDISDRIEQEMKQHPDAHLFTCLPGAGKAMAPRLVAAFGSQRDRYYHADEVATLSGIAPVTKQSGKSRVVHRRFACPKFLRQTFHEFADHARKWCPWSRAYYAWQRSRGMKHHAVLRKLASRWIRILFSVWKHRTPYDPTRYLEALKRKNPAIVSFLAIEN